MVSMIDRSRPMPLRLRTIATAITVGIGLLSLAPEDLLGASELSAVGTPSIDGTISQGEWARAAYRDFPVNVVGGGTVPGRVYVMNDSRRLYFAITFGTMADRNSAAIQFENDAQGDVSWEFGDDVLLYNPDYGIGFLDEVIAVCSVPGTVCGKRDTDLGGTNNGSGAFAKLNGVTTYEFSHPLDSSDNSNDFSLKLGDPVRYELSIRMLQGGGLADTDFPGVPNVPSTFGLIRVAKALTVPVDVAPKACPSPFVPSSAQTIIAVAGTKAAPASLIDPASIRVAGAAPLSWRRVDLTRPYTPYVGKSGPRACTAKGADGITDLVLTFATAAIVRGLGWYPNSPQALALSLSGRLVPSAGGKAIMGEDITRVPAS